MPFIPVVQSRERIEGSYQALDRSYSRVVASPDAYGAQVGRAIQGLAVGFDNLVTQARDEENKQRAERVSLAVAQTPLAQPAVDAQNNAPPDGKGLVDATIQGQIKLIDETADKLFADDHKARQAYKTSQYARIPGYANQAVVQANKMRIDQSTDEANKGLNVLYNKVRTEPQFFDQWIKDGNDLIDASPLIPPHMKDAQKKAFAMIAQQQRFEGLINVATTPEELDKIQKQLQDPKHNNVLPIERQENIERQIKGRIQVLSTKADADANKAIDMLAPRALTEELNPEELSVVRKMVEQTGNAHLAMRFGRMVRDQEQFRHTRGLPPSQIAVLRNDAQGGINAAFPNLPPELNTYITKASNAFPGVSSVFLGGTANREVGNFFPQPQRPRGKPNILRTQPNTPDDAYVDPQLPINYIARPEGGYVTQGKTNWQGIIFHHTAGPTIESALGILNQGDANRGGQKFGYHFYIDRDGQIYQATPLTARSAHVSGFGRKIRPDLQNHNSIGISFVGSGDETPVQIAAAQALALSLQKRFNIPTENMYGHGEVQYSRMLTEGMSVVNRLRRGDPQLPLAPAAPQQVVPDDGKWKTVANPTSGATGVYQFLPPSATNRGAWLTFMDSPEFQATLKQHTGKDISQLTEAQKLKLREDPEVSTFAAAAYAAQNKRQLEGPNGIGRPVTDSELYMAHFFGAGGAGQFLRAHRDNKLAVAAEVMPNAVKGNEPIFFDQKNGNRPRSVEEVYNLIATTFTTQPNYVRAADATTYNTIYNQRKKQLNENPVRAVQYTHPTSPLDPQNPQSYVARGQQFGHWGSVYELPASENKPLDADTEVAAIKKRLEDGSVEEKLGELRNLSMLDKGHKGAFAAALKQVGHNNSEFAVAGQLLQYEDGQSAATAATIVRGATRLKEDSTIKSMLGNESEAQNAFERTLNGALYSLDPSARDALFKAAKAHYVETNVGQRATFNANAFAQSVHAVMGGTTQQPRVAGVNGYNTVLPRGVTQPEMNAAIDNLNADDLTALSVLRDGRPAYAPPVYMTGEPVSPQDIANQARLNYKGGDVYEVRMRDNLPLMTPVPDERTGMPQPYLIRLNKDIVDKINKRKGVPTGAVPLGMENIGAASPQLSGFMR